MIALVGESGSGKSSVAKCLVNNFGFNNVVTYTTRQPREKEVDGIDYHFISELDFEAMANHQFFAETANYNGWYYGSAKKDYMDSQKKIAVYNVPYKVDKTRRRDFLILNTAG